MTKQNFELKNEKIRDSFMELKKNHGEKLKSRLKLSWNIWGVWHGIPGGIRSAP